MTSLVRLVGAYHINDPVYAVFSNPSSYVKMLIAFQSSIFKLTYSTFVVAFLHFFSEWQLYKTTKLGKGLAGPLIVSSMFQLLLLDVTLCKLTLRASSFYGLDDETDGLLRESVNFCHYKIRYH